MSAVEAAAGKAQAMVRDSVKTVIAASMVGTAIEFYDFYAYGTAAANYFPKVFFGDTTNPTVALLASLLTFAIAFIARPLGSLVFGHFGDRMGRKTTLVVSLLTMALKASAFCVKGKGSSSFSEVRMPKSSASRSCTGPVGLTFISRASASAMWRLVPTLLSRFAAGRIASK